MLTIPDAIQTSATVASYEVSILLAKYKKQYSDGDIVKKCAIRMAIGFGDSNIARKLETVSLSHQTEARRIADMDEHVPTKLLTLFNKCILFSICLDKSIDISYVSQLLIFICAIQKDFSIQEELLNIVPLYENVKALDIQEILQIFREYM